MQRRHEFLLPARYGQEQEALQRIIIHSSEGSTRAPVGVLIIDGRSYEVFAEFVAGGNGVISSFVVRRRKRQGVFIGLVFNLNNFRLEHPGNGVHGFLTPLPFLKDVGGTPKSHGVGFP